MVVRTLALALVPVIVAISACMGLPDPGVQAPGPTSSAVAVSSSTPPHQGGPSGPGAPAECFDPHAVANVSNGFAAAPAAPSEGWRERPPSSDTGSDSIAFRWRSLETPQGETTEARLNWTLNGTTLWLAVWAGYVSDQHGFAPGGNITLSPPENGLRRMEAKAVTAWTDAYFGGPAENCLQIEVPGLEAGEYELNVDLVATCDECAPQSSEIESWTVRFIVAPGPAAHSR